MGMEAYIYMYIGRHLGRHIYALCRQAQAYAGGQNWLKNQ